VRFEQDSVRWRGCYDAPAALKHDGGLIANAFGIDQPDDAVLVASTRPTSVSPVGVRIVMRPLYREADRRAAKLAAGRRQFTLLTCPGATVPCFNTAAVPIIPTLNRSSLKMSPRFYLRSLREPV
jgi:hypothetical protein